jgi:predicted metal-binding membrane protein
MLLFVVGAMNLLWMALLSVFVVAEKIFPRGEHLGRIAGLLFVGIGGWLAFGMFA